MTTTQASDTNINFDRASATHAHVRPETLPTRELFDGEMIAGASINVSLGTPWAPPLEEDRRTPVRQGRPEGRRAWLAGDAIREERLSVERQRVLLAEDHDDTRALLACMLRGEGYEVVEAASGYDLLDEIASSWLKRSGRMPDLIITDVRMPGPTGLRVLDGIRASTWAMPVIVITAFGDAETHAEARRLGAHVVLDKPFELDQLRQAVAEVLSS